MNILRFYRTIKYLKFKQLWYQVVYRTKIYNIINFRKKIIKYSIAENLEIDTKYFLPSNKTIEIIDNLITFTFLNKSVTFRSDYINWNFNEFGKLWQYNLNYFNYLLEIDEENGLKIILNYIKSNPKGESHEPYPRSIRIVNFIKFCLKFKITNKTVDNFILNEVNRLNKHKEYHIAGNHILENLVSLFISSIYFSDLQFKSNIINEMQFELKNQFSLKGVHYERSLMYQIHLMNKIFDCLLFNNGKSKEIETIFLNILKNSTAFVNWFNLNNLTNFNDSNSSQIGSISSIINYFNSKNIILPIFNDLLISGYYRYVNNDFKLIANYGAVISNEQPGHSHADTFSFILLYQEIPIIVDMGISTYEKSIKRVLQKSTKSHNTVSYNNLDSSEIWSAFRMGRRANIHDLKFDKDYVSAYHDGYMRLNVIHKRVFNFAEKKICIKDNIINCKGKSSISNLYFHPNVEFNINKDKILINKDLEIYLYNVENWILKDYEYCVGFNKTKTAKCLSFNFYRESTIEISQTVINEN